MTACPKWKDGLLDLALGVPAPSKLEAHLKTCAACSAALVELRARRQQMDTVLPRLMRGIEPSGALRARLMALPETAPPRTQAWPARVRVLAAAALVFVAAVTLVISSHRRMGPREPDQVFVSGGGLAEWQSPTGSLLRSSAGELIRSGPDLGRFYFPLQSTRENKHVGTRME